MLRGEQKFEAYLLSEWESYVARPEAQRASLDAVAGRKVTRVLDVGCGAGQQLVPFVRELGAKGAGVDVSPVAVQVATRQFAKLGYSEKVDFRRCPAESLPFERDSFDVVICRLALSYMINRQALAEMARVLRPGGLLILRIMSARYYLRSFWRDLTRAHLWRALYDVRVLVAGTLFQVTGHQPNNRILKRTVFETRWMLRRLSSSVGLVIAKELQASAPDPCAPTLLIEKRAALA